MKTALDGVREAGAILDPERRYRYALWREESWDLYPRFTMFIGLNPSTASERVNDQTIAKLIGFTKRWEYGGFVIANLFAYRSENPTELAECKRHGIDPVGPDNDEWIDRLAKEAERIVVCWGNYGCFDNREEVVLDRLMTMKGAAPLCFGVTEAGFPKHPCRLAYATKLEPYEE